MLELNKIYCMDCLDFLKQIDDKSIDLVLIDPPYFQVMVTDWKGEKHDWDNQHKTIEEYQDWIFKLGQEIKRVLKLNGSFYIFADDKVCAYVQIKLDSLFYLENSITWVKPNNLTIKGWNKYKSYAPITEKILFYSNEILKKENNKFSQSGRYDSIRRYFREEFDKASKIGKKTKYFREILGLDIDAGGLRYFCENQWIFPPKEHYLKMQESGFFKRSYEEVSNEYELENIIFNPESNFTDVWTFNIMGGKESLGKHPTQKPLEIIKRIIKTSSKEGSLVLDCFVGSGTTALACQQLGRNFIGCDNKEEYVKIANERLAQKVLA